MGDDLLAFGRAPPAQAEADVFAHGEPRENAVLLEDEDAARVRAVHRLAFDEHLAARRLEEAADDVEQRRFAAAGRADEADELALAQPRR